MMTLDLFPEARVDPGDLPNDRYTLAPTLDYCRRFGSQLLGRPLEYTLDVAACREAHVAPHYYSLREGVDGLLSPWVGDVWCNPPYDDLETWVMRAWRAVAAQGGVKSISMLPPGDRTEQPWWQRWVKPYRDGRGTYVPGWELVTEELPGRQCFGHPGNPTGKGVAGAMFPSVLLFWRPY